MNDVVSIISPAVDIGRITRSIQAAREALQIAEAHEHGAEQKASQARHATALLRMTRLVKLGVT